MTERKRRLSLLKLEPQDKPVWFVVEDFCPADDTHEGRRYYFEVHACPTNFIECEAIISEGNDDQHGLFEYVRTVDAPPEIDSPTDEPNWRELFPEAFENPSPTRQEGE